MEFDAAYQTVIGSHRPTPYRVRFWNIKALVWLRVLGLISLCHSHQAIGQVLVGGGYSELYLNDNRGHDVAGYHVMIQKETALAFQKTDRWSICSAINIGLMTSAMNYKFSPSYKNTISLSSSMAYRLLRWRRAVFSPYLGPFINYTNGLTIGGHGIESRSNSQVNFGLEMGVAVQYQLTDHFSIKVLPFNLQWGTNHFQQAMLSVLFYL